MTMTTPSARYGSGLRLTLASCAVSSALLLTACGGGGGGGNGPDNTTPEGGTENQAGVFLDSVVANIDYFATPSGIEGTTNDSGAFIYKAGDRISFNIGGVRLPAVAADEVVTPLDMGGDINDARVVNILRLLQSLDSSGDLDDGIQIDDNVKTAAAGEDLDFDSASFDSEAGTFLGTVSGGGTTLVAEDDATAHFTKTLVAEGESADDSIVGSYYDDDTVVVFAADGSFYLAYFDPDAVSTDDTGMEVGTYSYVGGEIHINLTVDGNAAKGFNDGSVYTVVSGGSSEDDGGVSTAASGGGSTLTLNDGSGDFTLTSLDSVSGELTGAWQSGDGNAVLVFAGPATYESADYYVIQIDEANQAFIGVERGTVDYNLTTNELSSTVNEETTGEAGLDGRSYTVEIDGDLMGVVESGDEVDTHSFARIDKANTSGESGGGSSAGFQTSDFENRIFQYEVTAGGDAGLKGFTVFESGGTGEGLDFVEFTGTGDGDDGVAWGFNWDVPYGELELDYGDGDSVTVMPNATTTEDGTEVYTVNTTDSLSTEMVLRRSVPFQEADFAGETYHIVPNGAENTHEVVFNSDGTGTIQDIGSSDASVMSMAWRVDPAIGYLEIEWTETKDFTLAMADLGDSDNADSDFQNVLLMGYVTSTDEFEAAFPGSSLTRQP